MPIACSRPHRLLLSLAACAALPAAALAQDGFFIGAALGAASISEDDKLIPIHDTSTAFKLFGGYRLGDHLAFEAAYLDLDDVAEVVFIQTQAQRAGADAHGVGLAVAGHFPLGRLSLHAKLGAFLWEADGERAGAALSDDGIDPFIGLGAGFALNDALTLQLEYERYEMDDIEADVVTLGLRARF